MGRPRGYPKSGGRQKGTPNKSLGESARESIARCFVELGGVQALKQWAADNQTEFYKIFARLLPVESHVSGPNGDPIPVDVSDSREAFVSRLGAQFAAGDRPANGGGTLQ